MPSFTSHFKTFPTLRTARLEMRAIVAADAGDYFREISHAEVGALYSNRDSFERRSLAKVTEIIKFNASAFRSKRTIAWGLYPLKGKRSLIGMCKLFDFRNGTIAETGYWLARPRWGKGLMTEAMQGLLGHAFGTLGLHRVFAQTDPRNAASIAMLRRLGFTQEGILRKATLRDDGWCDSVLFGILNDDWVL